MLRKFLSARKPFLPAALLLFALPAGVAAQNRLVVTGPGDGHAPVINVVVRGEDGDDTLSILAYPRSFTGGVRVAIGDVNGDGVPDFVAAPGLGVGPHVHVFDGDSLRRMRSRMSSFVAYKASFVGGVYVAAGDVDGDGRAEIVTGQGEGGSPHVKVFDASDSLNLLHSFFAFDADFSGGVRVAAGDVNGDRFDDVIAGAGPGGGPHVRVFDSTSRDALHDFFAYGPNFRGGVYVAGFSAPRRR